jgi:four helix bundle protein
MNNRSQTSFEKLEVYRLSEELSDMLWDQVNQWSRLAQDTVGRQLVRAADSVGANLAEGLGRQSSKDRVLYTRYACGSLYEVRHWLRRAEARQLLQGDELLQCKSLCAELIPRLNAYLRSSRLSAS